MIRCPALASLRAELARRVGDVLEVSREEGGEVEGGEGGSSLLPPTPTHPVRMGGEGGLCAPAAVHSPARRGRDEVHRGEKLSASLSSPAGRPRRRPA